MPTGYPEMNISDLRQHGVVKLQTEEVVVRPFDVAIFTLLVVVTMGVQLIPLRQGFECPGALLDIITCAICY
jgi:hypothetical protein